MTASRRISTALFMALSFLFAGVAAGDEVISESWQVTYFQEKPLGYSHTVVSKVERDGTDLYKTAAESVMRINRFGQVLEISVDYSYLEDWNGNLLEVWSRTDNMGSITEMRGVAEGETMKITTTIGGRERTSEADITVCLGPYAIERLIRDKGLTEGAEIEFRTFISELQKASIVKVRTLGREKTQLLDGEEELWKIETKTELMGITVTSWVDDDYVTKKSFIPMLGGMTSYETTREQALASVGEDAESADLLSASSALCNILIPRPYETERVLYKITLKGDSVDADAFNLLGQRIVKQEGNALWLDVCALRPIPGKRVKRPVEMGDLDESYIKPGQYIESDNEAIVAVAREVVGDEQYALAAARKLEKWVYDHMGKTMSAAAFNTAAETMELLQGDCTEHGVLLAALLRAAGIPSRVVVGVVYGGGAFYGHMWTEAYLDLLGWVALDATMAQHQADAARIKMSETALADQSIAEAFLGVVKLLGNIEVEVLEVQLDGKVLRCEGLRNTGRVEGDLFIDDYQGFSIDKPADWAFELVTGDEKLGGSLLRIKKGEEAVTVRVAPSSPHFDLDSFIAGLRASGAVEEIDLTRRHGLPAATYGVSHEAEGGEKEIEHRCVIRLGDVLFYLSSAGMAEDAEAFEAIASSFKPLLGAKD